jgi:UV DNA damage endonuclease
MKVGFACMVMEEHDSKCQRYSLIDKMPGTKIGKVYVTHVKDLDQYAAMEKIVNKVSDNVQALTKQLEYVGSLPETQRMFRISSDLFPLFDHEDYEYVYRDSFKIREIFNVRLRKLGEYIKEKKIRVSVHPSQFITLFSDKKHVRDSSYKHVKKWIEIFDAMGLCPFEDGYVIVMHTNGHRNEWDSDYDDCKQYIGLENDEKKAGFKKTLQICQDNDIRMVLDVHHYYCENKEHIGLNSPQMKEVIGTWKGWRPKMHISSSRGTENFKELCSHADYITKEDMERFWEWAYHFDIMVEAKHKNLASNRLHRHICKKMGI